MKRVISVFMTLTMLVSLAACGTTGTETETSEAAAESVSSQAEETVGETEETAYETVEETDEQEITSVNIEVTEDFRQAEADFSWRLFAAGLEEKENTLVSPVSVLTALAMAANGANGETRTQMLSVLGDSLSLDDWNAALTTGWVSSLANTGASSLSMANSVWLRNDADWLTVRPEYLDSMNRVYGAGIFEADFSEAATVGEINAWVKENTGGMIPEIIDQLSEESALLLINAVSFDAEWEVIYAEYSIREEEFTREDGSTETVSMMYSEEYAYLEDENAVGFLKNYTDGYRFVVLLPDEGVSVQDYVTQMTGERFLEILDSADWDAWVETSMPAFQSDYSKDLTESLMDMGMTDAFDASMADFSVMGECSDGRNLTISQVLHKTTITVDALGTKAGAATALDVYAAGAIEDVKTVRCDRPYVYAIVDGATNLPIFLGTVMQVGE